MRALRVSVPIGVLVLVSASLAATAQAGPLGLAPPVTVSCSTIIGTQPGPDSYGYRPVLGVVSVPPAYLPQVVRSDDGDWPYWRKAALVVHAGRVAVTVSVPRAWRRRVAIAWGNRIPGGVRVIRFEPCPPPPKTWNAYAGGFLLRSRSACVPLIFYVGLRSQTVRFGIGRHCS